MPLDLLPIHKRLAAIDPVFWRDACAPEEGDEDPEERVFVANAPDDIAALLLEVELLHTALATAQERARDIDRLCSELTGLRTYLTRSIADDLAGVPEALEILDGLADEDMATVDRWIAAMSPRCRHEAAVTQTAPRFIVRLEPGVWIAPWKGDPGRTTVKASAKRFPTERSARRALSKARRFREFPLAVVERVP